MIHIRKEEIVGWKERRLGELVHRVLELNIGCGFSLSSSIEKAIIESLGELEREEGREFLRNLFSEIDRKPDWRRFMEMLSSREKIPELDILAPEGQRFRIDLLLVGDPSLVIDYKYAHPREEHRWQIENYCRLLQPMFARLEGYLLYLSEKSVRLERVV